MNTVGVIYRNPGGKPSKPGKPGGGKPFERPEGENWVIFWILSTTKSHQLLLVIWAENFIFTFRWGTGSRRRSDAREFPNSIALSFLTPTSIVTRFHPWHCNIFSVVIFLITRWSTWRRLSATTGRTSTSVRSLSTPRWSPSPWVSSTMINCPARFVQSQTSLSSSAANWRPQSPTRAQRFWSAQKFRSRVGGNPRVGKLFKFSSFIILILYSPQ